jgi:hypothetical protein
MNTQPDFEAWAKLLIARKVPQNFSHLIDPDVIHSGADILKHGGAFEVHLEQPSRVSNPMARSESCPARIFVTPILARAVHAHTN